MTTIFVYGDESGTMPEKKADGPFVTCCIATTKEIPSIESHKGNLVWTIDKLFEYEGTPHFTFVIPNDEYEEKYKLRMSKMNTMARMTRMMTGKNVDYLTDDGFNPRNYVWIRTMSTSIGQVMIEKLFRHEINAISILLDQKAIAIPNRRLFTRKVKEIASPLDRVLQKIYSLNPSEITRIAGNAKFMGNVVVRWSDHPSVKTNDGGLILTHNLAKSCLKGLKRGNPANSTLFIKLAEHGFKDYYRDITNEFLELNKDVVADWKRNTGLPEPEA